LIQRRSKRLLALGVAAALVFAALPWLIRGVWAYRSSNPVRRGVVLATDLGCFSCHGPLGGKGVPDPGGEGLEVPAWSGGLWMMYVSSDEEIREFILDGVSRKRAASQSAKKDRERMAVRMPAFESVLGRGEIDDLVAAFRVLSGMSHPPEGSAEERGQALARTWRCFACHNAGAAGGLPNPKSFAGFIPGWYGADFRDLVRGRGEFDDWIRKGRIDRLDRNLVASFFIRRQRIRMPAYEKLTPQELDDLWAYGTWLGETGGVVRERP